MQIVLNTSVKMDIAFSLLTKFSAGGLVWDSGNYLVY